MRPSVSAGSARWTTFSISSVPIRAGRSVSRKERMAAKIGIVAGSGTLPRRLIESCQASGREVFVLALDGEAEPEAVAGVPHAWCRLGAAGKGLDLLRANEVSELVLAGGVRRPSITSLRPDWRAAKFFARVGRRVLGDDGLLSAIVKELEREEHPVEVEDRFLDDCRLPQGPTRRPGHG